MSDSESEFESADEGSKSNDGWEVDDNFELPSLSTPEPSKCEFEAAKNFKQNIMPDTIPILKSRIDRHTINNDNTNFEQQIPEESKNEIKSSNTQSNNVSKSMKVKDIYNLVPVEDYEAMFKF